MMRVLRQSNSNPRVRRILMMLQSTSAISNSSLMTSKTCAVSPSFLVGFHSASLQPNRFTSTNTPLLSPVKKIYHHNNLLRFCFGQKLHNPLGHFVGTRHYSGHRFRDYIYKPLLKCLNCVTFFTGRFERGPFRRDKFLVFPFVDKIRGELYLRRWREACKMGMILPRTHPHCVRVQSIGGNIVEALQGNTGRRHVLVGFTDGDGEVKVMKNNRRKGFYRYSDVNLEEGIDWEFCVVDDPKVGAGCMNIGMNKAMIVVFKGLFDCYKTDDEIAFIIAHEVGHAVCRHGQRTLSWLPFVSGPFTNNEKYFYSSHEHEADQLGILLSAIAGYDPRVAPATVEKMKFCLKLVPENNEHFCCLKTEKRIEFMNEPAVMDATCNLFVKTECRGSRKCAEIRVQI